MILWWWWWWYWPSKVFIPRYWYSIIIVSHLETWYHRCQMMMMVTCITLPIKWYSIVDWPMSLCDDVMENFLNDVSPNWYGIVDDIIDLLHCSWWNGRYSDIIEIDIIPLIMMLLIPMMTGRTLHYWWWWWLMTPLARTTNSIIWKWWYVNDDDDDDDYLLLLMMYSVYCYYSYSIDIPADITMILMIRIICLLIRRKHDWWRDDWWRYPVVDNDKYSHWYCY